MGLQSFISHRSIRSVAWLTTLAAALTCCTHAQAPSGAFLLPTNVISDAAGNLYVSETTAHVVRKISARGQLFTIAGTATQGFDGDGGPATAALLDSPLGLALGNGQLYIADSHNHRVRKVDLTSGIITTVAGGPFAGSAGDGGAATQAMLDLPTALAVGSGGELYIADARAHRIRRMDAKGLITTVVGTGVEGFDGDVGDAAAALLDAPSGLATDLSGNLYIADTRNNRVRRVDAATGAISTLAGTKDFGFNGDGNGVTAKLALPKGLSLDNLGNVYVADSANHRIRRIDAGGKVTTIAGNGTQGFSGDGGSPVSSSLDSPGSVTSFAQAVSIADTGNSRIREIAGDSIQSGHYGISVPELTLAGASTVIYGSGSLLATLSSPAATGMVTFTDRAGVEPVRLANIPLESGSAVLDTSTMAAGPHKVVATYAGNTLYGGAISPAFDLVVNPIVLTAIVTPDSSVYGMPILPLSGTLQGVLPRDQSSVAASFTTLATALSHVGVYPVAIALSGTSAVNYTISSGPK